MIKADRVFPDVDEDGQVDHTTVNVDLILLNDGNRSAGNAFVTASAPATALSIGTSQTHSAPCTLDKQRNTAQVPIDFGAFGWSATVTLEGHYQDSTTKVTSNSAISNTHIVGSP